jgi:hypothetical protein
MDLSSVLEDIADILKTIDSSGSSFKSFQAGVGPYGEPQLTKLLAQDMSALPRYSGGVIMKRTPDLLISEHWAIEIKIVRPFGDNGKLAEDWSVNLLHPYLGNSSLLGDCLKLAAFPCPEQKAVLAICFEHDPPQVDLDVLVRSFEHIARNVLSIQLGRRQSALRSHLIHPVHQRLAVYGWQLG